jgi:hypothetical protein
MALPTTGLAIQSSLLDIYQLSANQIDSIRPVIIFGHNDDLDAGTLPETLVPWGGLVSIPSAVGTLSIVSSSANDTSDGTGARTVIVNGLDSNKDILEVTYTLNGTTPVVSASVWTRINKIYVTSVGSGGVNAGTITFTHSNTSAILGQINANEGCSHACVYSVPNNYTLFVSRIEGHMTKLAGDQAGEIAMYRRDGATGALWQCFKVGVHTKAISVLDLNSTGYFAVGEKSDVFINATYTTTDSVVMTAMIRGVIVRNTELSTM